MSPFCLGCRRPIERCACEVEFVSVDVPDPLFPAAAAQGFEPLTEEARASFREKAGIFLRVVGGR